MAGQKDKDYGILKKFIEVYCSKNHGTNGNKLCLGCSELLEYSRARLENCPYDPKPKCKDCETHCYRPKYRQRISEVMRFSSMHFVRRGRLDFLLRYML